MEILLGAVVALLTEAVKYINKKLGDNGELTKNVVVLIAFVLSLLGATGYIIFKAVATEQMLQNIITIWGTATLFYQVVIKSVVLPLLSNANTKSDKPTS